MITKESILRLHKEMNSIGFALEYYHISKHLRIISKMPNSVLKHYYKPYTYKTIQKKIYYEILKLSILINNILLCILFK